MNPLNPLSFTSHQKNWGKCLLFFWMINWPKHQFCQIAKCQMAFLWYLLNCRFYHSKIEKYTLSLSQFFLMTGFFEGTREIYYTYSEPKDSNKSTVLETGKLHLFALIWASVGQARLVIHILASFSYAVGVAPTYECKEVFGVFKLLISILSAFNTIGLFILWLRPLKALAEIPKFSLKTERTILRLFLPSILLLHYNLCRFLASPSSKQWCSLIKYNNALAWL